MIKTEQIGDLVLYQSSEEFKLTRDSLALAQFPRLRRGMRVCDLGCGVGNILIGLAARQTDMIFDGVELRATAAQLCRRSLAENGLDGTIVTGNLTERHEALPWGGYDLVCANPPYYAADSGAVSSDEAKASARTQREFTINSACVAANRLCKNGGQFVVCIPPSMLTDLMVCLRKYNMEPKRLQLLHSASDREANLALIEAKKGGKAGGLRVLPMHTVR